MDKDLEQKIENEIENCCRNIFHELLSMGRSLDHKDVLGLSDVFFTKLDRQNVKVIRANDPAEKQSFTGE